MLSFPKYSTFSVLLTFVLLMLSARTDLSAQNPLAFVYGGYYAGTQDSEMTSEGYAGTVDRDSNYINVATFTGGIYPDPNSNYRLFSFNVDLVDMVLAKYDRRGRMSWTKRIGSASANEYPYDVETDPDGNIYVCGNYGLSGAMSVEGNFDPDGIDSLPTQNHIDAFLAKYDADGNYLWALNLGTSRVNTGSYSEVISDIAIDNSGNVFVVGMYASAINFNPRGEELVKSHGGEPSDNALFVAKYNSDGICQWVCPVVTNFVNTSSNHDYPACGLDGAGNLYVAGTFSGDNVDFAPCESFNFIRSGSNDMFLIKYNPDNGAGIWLKSFTGSVGTLARIADMAVRPDGTVAIAGSLSTNSGTVDMDPSANEAILTYPSLFYALYDSSGAFIKAVGLPQSQLRGTISAVAFDSTGRVVLGGMASYGFGPHHSSTSSDAYIAWFGDTVERAHVFSGSGTPPDAVSRTRDVTVDPENNVLIAGKLAGKDADVDPGKDTFLLSTWIWINCFIIKYSGDGTLWKDLEALSAPDWAETDTPLAFQFVQSKGRLSILVGENISTNLEVVLCDAMGREVERERVRSKETRLDVSRLPSGFCIAFIVEEERIIAAKKILVEN